MRHTAGQRILTALSQVALWIWVLLAMVPLVWMVTTSIKPEGYAQTIPPTWQFQPTLQHYVDVLRGAAVTPFGPLLLHSVIVAVGSTALALVLGLFAAYALARLRFKANASWPCGSSPPSCFPRCGGDSDLHHGGPLQLIDRYLTLIVPYAAFNLPLVIWVLRSSIRQIPEEIEDAALVDGAHAWRSSPGSCLAAPGIATAGILSMLLAWNEFLFALTLTRSQVNRAGWYQRVHRHVRHEWGSLSAAATTIVAPVVLMALLLRRHLIEGLTLGAVK